MVTCSYIQAQADNGCWDLAQRCGISTADLEKYNPVPNFCSNIILDQYVCCSAGDLPDFSPKPDDDGNCFVYTVQDGDLCVDIAKAHKMDADKIEDYNTMTWGFRGCSNLDKYGKICLSEGDPPFPAAVKGNVCGPQVPGTEKPSSGSPWDWAEMNPCPLNACCDVWGQCGITPEFCTNTTENGGAPGTAKKDTNGCISHCGTEVKSSGSGPETPRRIGYFEAWNANRKCAHMDVSKMTDGDIYTHVHWAFGNVTADFKIDVSGLQDQFDGLLKLEGIKRIMSFGGWGFSTEAQTHIVFRNAVLAGNRETLAANVIKFITDNGLDGVDFDWEYPGAQDLPDIPPDSLESGKNYAEFIKLVRSGLPKEKSVSMALPASYWYLKGFHPVTQFDDYIDYYVYMTYDLHGQWDADNTFVNPGCSNGNCLRSHVNKTETEYTLAMITKAGIPSNKVVPGLALYGRSFEMTDPSCKGPECTFTGTRTHSNAVHGECTDTGGYISNIEIRNLMTEADGREESDITYEEYEDEGDILIYNENQWVAWLSHESYLARQQWYDDMNFGGSVDWAADLNRSYGDDGTGDLEESEEDWPSPEPCPGIFFPYLEGLQVAIDAGAVPNRCIAQMTLETLISELDRAYDNYTEVSNGYDEMFDYYVKYMEKLVPSVLEHAFMFNTSITEDPDYAVPKPGDGMHYFDCNYRDSGWENCFTTFEEGTSRRRSIGDVSTDITAGSTTSSDIANRNLASRAVAEWELRLTDEDGYGRALAHAGMLPEWVDLGDFALKRMNFDTTLELYWTWYFSGFPVKNESMEVQNPKDIVTHGLPNIPSLRSDMQKTMLEIIGGMYIGGDPRDAALAYAPSVFIMQQAIESMAQAKKIGEQEEKDEAEEERERKESFIMLIISVVLIFVPVVGAEFAAAAGLANLARVIAIGGELANAALATYDTVKNPESAVVNILGMLFGLGDIAKAARTGKGLAEVASWRKGMKADEILSMGTIFKRGDDMVQSVLGKVCKIS